MEHLYLITSIIVALLSLYAVITSLRLYDLVQKSYDSLNSHSHDISPIGMPAYVQKSDEAVFVYDPRMSHYPLYNAAFAYFENTSPEKKDWKIFSYKKKKHTDEPLKETFPVGEHSFSFKDDSQVHMWFVLYEPVMVAPLNTMRHPFRIIIRGPNAIMRLHCVMNTIATVYIDKGKDKFLIKTTQKGIATVIPFKQKGN